MDEADLADFTALSDGNGEIAKKDLIVHTKASSFWRGYMEAKSRPGSHTSKVRLGTQFALRIFFVFFPGRGDEQN